MKILLVNYEFPPLGGGGGVGSYHIAKELVKGGHKIDVVTTWYKGLPRFEVIDGIRVYRVPVIKREELATATWSSMLSFLPPSLAKGYSLLRGHRYEVINTHFAVPSGLTGIILAKVFRVPHVLTIIGGDIYDPTKGLSPHNTPILKRVVRYVLNASQAVAAISEDTRKRAQEYYGCRKEIAVIHYGLPPTRFRRKTRAELNLSDDDFILIAIGRLIERKGLKYLLQAMSRLRDERVRLLIIGEGPEEANLRSLAADLNITPQISFLGPIWGEAKLQYLSASDLFVLPSLHEGFGIVFIEAMYCGLPVVTTDCGGQTDFLKDGETGFLVPVGNAEALARRVQILRQDGHLRQKISQHNRRYVKRFYISGTARSYEKLFEEAVRLSRGV